jgi:hypothetical protein
MGFEGILAWLQLKASQWCSWATWVLDLDEVPFSGPCWRILKSLTLNNDDKDRGLPKSLLGRGSLWCPNHPKSDICTSWAYPKFRVCVSSCYHSLSIGTLAHGSLDVSSLDQFGRVFDFVNNQSWPLIFFPIFWYCAIGLHLMRDLALNDDKFLD